MAQLSLYIEDSMIEKLNIAAKMQNCSVSKYVAALVSDNLSNYEVEERQKKQILKQLCGALDDPTFSPPEKIPEKNEIPRRFDLV